MQDGDATTAAGAGELRPSPRTTLEGDDSQALDGAGPRHIFFDRSPGMEVEPTFSTQQPLRAHSDSAALPPLADAASGPLELPFACPPLGVSGFFAGGESPGARLQAFSKQGSRSSLTVGYAVTPACVLPRLTADSARSTQHSVLGMQQVARTRRRSGKGTKDISVRLIGRTHVSTRGSWHAFPCPQHR